MKKASTYVMSFKASYLIKNGQEVATQTNGKEWDFVFKYKATIPFSMDTIALNEIYPLEIRKNKKSRQYTDAIVNVRFDKKDYYDEKVNSYTLSKEEVRQKLYSEGFMINGIKYVEFKRSSSKAREGNTLFIKEELLDEMINWSRMNIEFTKDEEIDIASLRAYESLSLSGLEDLVHISRNQIVLISDYNSVFKEMVSATEIMDGEVTTTDKEIEISNSIWDGQALLDSTVFNKVGRSKKGCMLLRNRFFKGCAFNTRIYDFLKSRRIKKVTDIFDREYAIKDVKLIITPSCLKLFKFAYKFESQQAMYEYWLNNIDEEFGICKSEKPSHFENMNQLSYQMINSMDLSKDEVKELASYEFDYLKGIQMDDNKFLEHIAKDDDSYTRSAINEIVKMNSNFLYTDLFRKFRTKTISDYKKRIRIGKLKITDTDYCTVVSNPYEMLLHLIGQFDGTTQALEGYEVYTPKYDRLIQLAGFRNPLIASGNVLLSTNTYHDNLRWFKLVHNIVVINSIQCNILQRCQGMDMDSDTLLMTSNELVVQKAIENAKYLTPVNCITAQKKLLILTATNKAAIDNTIANNAIGQVVNQSQICNSYYWDKLNARASNEELKKIYDDISLLSSLSQIEIDKAKKYIEIDSNKICFEISKKYRINPKFMKLIKNKKAKLKVAKMNCPMDYLQELVNDEVNRSNQVDIIDILGLLISQEKSVNKNQIDKIQEILLNADKEIKSIHADTNRDEDRNKKQEIRDIEDDAIEKIGKMHINSATIECIIRRMCSKKSKDKSMNGYRMRMFKMLAVTQRDEFAKCFISLHEKTA